MAKGLPPAQDPELDAYLESCPEEIYAALEGAARHLAAKRNDALAVGYLVLMQRLLERLRYRTDRGDPEAVAMVAEFQVDVVARANAGLVDRSVLAYVGGALHEARIAASPELIAASAAHIEQQTKGPFPADVQAALAAMMDSCGDDPFVLVGTLAQFSHALPVSTRASMAQHFALGGTAAARSAAVLFLLDAAPSVRRAAAAALVEVASSLAPDDLRRLSVIRNWRPEKERKRVDSVIRAVEQAGVEHAPWEQGGVETILGSAVDGSGSQGLLMLSAAGRKKRLSSILVKDGIADAWTAGPEARRSVEKTLADAAMADLPLFPVSRPYLDRVVRHSLAICVEKGRAPPLGLLQVAEAIGAAEWQPQRMDFAKTLAELLAEVPEAMRQPATLRSILRESGKLADLEHISDSWFDDGPEVAKLLPATAGRGAAKFVEYLLQTAFARDRGRWAELFLRTALWMREAPAEDELPWQHLALVSEAVAGQVDLAGIGLMVDIASRSLDAFSYRRSRADSLGWGVPSR